MTTLLCWRCGASLKDLPKPLTRLSQCKACGADLHVCRLCRYYNPKHFEKCDHDMAEPAREVDVANFCHYFRPTPQAYKPEEKHRADAAMHQLKALFGDEPDNNAAESEQEQELEAARARLEDLFKKSD